MLRLEHPDLEDGSYSLLGYLIGFAGIFIALSFIFYSFMKPVAVPNPGLAAYRPPPATRLEPLARTMDLPEVTASAEAGLGVSEEEAPKATMAEAVDPAASRRNADGRPSTKPQRPNARSNARKRPTVVVARHRPAQPAYAYAQAGNTWYRQPESAWGRFW